MILVVITYAVINMLWAWLVDGYLIVEKRTVPNHFLNGCVYLALIGVLFVWYNILEVLYLVPILFCIRQLFFDTTLNIRRGRNFFYSNPYTSFYQKQLSITSRSFVDRVENFFIDGVINKISGRRWSYIPEYDYRVKTFNNYLNGKIQFVFYLTVLIALIWMKK